MGIKPNDCMVAKAALYPPACPTRLKKSRLVIPIEDTSPRKVFCDQLLLSPVELKVWIEETELRPRGIVAIREELHGFQQ
jgi:hypothetical protein